jgi:outer membrane murein-binding lipoprotein Lpp
METAQVFALMAAVIGYLALQSFRQGAKLNTISSKVDTISEDVLELKTRLDLFLKNEIDALKEIAKK